ncbi:MAG: FAD-dependent oxidoreductase, partial [Thermoplasmata archaeon]|nr:FAD-dependent oxidoreductase [Thermoplasmata archaeon]
MPENRFDLVIIGAGAAGLASAIYGVRAGLKTVVLEGRGVGGQAGEAAEIENYPGFPRINGMELVMKFREHAEEYTRILEGKDVVSIEPVERIEGVHFRARDSDDGKYLVGAVLLSTGAKHRRLGVKGEAELSGKGVSYCATCDGFFFK